MLDECYAWYRLTIVYQYLHGKPIQGTTFVIGYVLLMLWFWTLYWPFTSTEGLGWAVDTWVAKDTVLNNTMLLLAFACVPAVSLVAIKLVIDSAKLEVCRL